LTPPSRTTATRGRTRSCWYLNFVVGQAVPTGTTATASLYRPGARPGHHQLPSASGNMGRRPQHDDKAEAAGPYRACGATAEEGTCCTVGAPARVPARDDRRTDPFRPALMSTGSLGACPGQGTCRVQQRVRPHPVAYSTSTSSCRPDGLSRFLSLGTGLGLWPGQRRLAVRPHGRPTATTAARSPAAAARQRQHAGLLPAQTGVMVEVTPEGRIVWKYTEPVTRLGPRRNRDISCHSGSNEVFKARKYALITQDLPGHGLTRGGRLSSTAGGQQPRANRSAPSGSGSQAGSCATGGAGVGA